MAMKSFSRKEALIYSWNTFKKNWKFLLGIIVIVAAVNFVPSLFQDQIKESFPAVNLVISIVLWFIQLVFSIGLIVISLKYIDRKKPKFEDLYIHYRLFINYFVGSLLYGLIVLVGLILFVVPGIIWAIKFHFYEYFIVDKKMGPLEALSASGKITKGNKWNLFLLGLIFFGLAILGLLAFGVGIFVVWPVAMIATAYVYRKLSS